MWHSPLRRDLKTTHFVEAEMSKRDELIGKYADVIRGDLGQTPDMDLLRKVTIGCGPSIYNRDASTIAFSDPKELETVKTNFLKKKLGLSDADDLDGALAKIKDAYSSRARHRAVVYYLLTKHFKKDGVYD